jgi:hypothetical protein
MATFPEFFRDHAVLPQGIDSPTEVDPEEDDWFSGYEDRREGLVDVAVESPGPPEWLFPADERDESDEIAVLEVPELEQIEPAEEEQLPPQEPSGQFTVEGSPGTDVVASYAPWHFYGDDWGIYFWATAFRNFANDVAFLARQPVSVVEPFVFHQVLEHERTHFEFEILGTELDRLLEEPCYRTYLFWRFQHPTHWSNGPLEEAIATWHEIYFAQRRRPKRPARYLNAVRRINDASPPGYRDWRCMEDDRRSDLVLTVLDGLIAGEQRWPTWTTRLNAASAKELKQVPVRWRGDPQLLPSFVVPKTLARPTVRQLRSWLKRNGATIEPRRGKGSHEGFEWNGRKATYGTGRDPVPKAESEKIARVFELRSARELYEAISAGRVVRPGVQTL